LVKKLGSNKQNIVVTGGAGFIGTNLIKRLVKDGHNVVSLDNYSTGTKSNHILIPDNCHYVDCDISEGVSDLYGYHPKFNAMENPDLIFHLAALPRIQPSFDYPNKTFDSNVKGTINVLEYAREKNNCPVVFAGSSSTHGDKYANPYTFTKWQGEELCKMYSEIYDLPTSICRFYNVYGPHQLTEGEYCTVIGIFERQMLDKVELTVTGDGEQKRDFTHVDDIVDGLMRCGEHFNFRGDEFEFGRGENFSINVIAQSFDWGYTYIPKRPGEMRETLCTDTKAKEMLGWEPKHNILDYIEERRNEIIDIHNSKSE